MRIATAAQAKYADSYTITDMGVPSLVLMETAANRIFDCCPAAKTAVIFCGGGNNGGDGFAVGRLLAVNNVDVIVVSLFPPEKMTADTQTEYTLAKRFGIPVISLTEAMEISSADLVIDAMLGIGQNGAPKEPIASAITLFNKIHGFKLAIDLPTGICSDTGKAYTPAVKADRTVTLGFLKPGLLFGDGAFFAGEVLLREFGIPQEAVTAARITAQTIDAALAESLFPTRKSTAHKYDVGSIAVFAGSVGMTGAATLAAQGALFSGAGLVTTAVPACIADIIAIKNTEALTLPLPHDGVSFAETAGKTAIDQLQKRSAAVIGCGIKNSPAADRAIGEFIALAPYPLVIDAGALPLTTHRPQHLRSATIITPHSGEAARLLSVTACEIEADRIGSAKKLTTLTGCICVLKGAHTVISTPDGHIYVNTTGNPGMATGGTGDVLAGVIASLIGQGCTPTHAAVCGVYLHGLAGNLAAEEIGEIGLTAGAVVSHLPQAISTIQRKRISP